MKIFLKRLFRGLATLFAVFVIIAALLMSIAHVLTPLLNRHRGDLEVWASQFLQVPVTINSVHADWRGNIPELTLTQVVALDKETQKPAFEVRELKLGIQVFSSLWKRKIVIQDVIISGSDLTIVQDASGSLTIKDLDLPVPKGKSNPSYQLTNILGWLFSQPYLALRDIDVHLTLKNGEKHEFSIKKVSLINSRDKHQINGNFVLHQEIPTEVKARIEWEGKTSDLDHIKVHTYLNLEGFSLSQWIKGTGLGLNKLFSGWQIRQGIGGAEIWLDWENKQLQQVQSIFQWYDLEFYSEYDKKTYPIESLSGHVGWKRDGERQIIAGDDLLINFPGHYWPATTFYVALAPKGLTLQELHLGYVDLQDILPIALANSSIPSLLRNKIHGLEPYGEFQAIEITWQGGLTDFTKTSLSGNFKDLRFNPLGQMPGLAHLSGKWKWDGSLGELQLESKDFVLIYPALFAESLDFNQFDGKLSFEYNPLTGWLVQTNDFKLADADLKAQAYVQMQFPPKTSPKIDLIAGFSMEQLSRVAHFLPVRVMDADLVVWLKNAFVEGSLESGKAVVQGNLNEFPFDAESGRFEVSGDLKEVDFHYAPQWPNLQQLDGKLLFAGRAMKVSIASASILDIPLKQISGVIPYLGADKPQILSVQTQVDTDLSQGLDFIHQSPLEEDLGKDLQDVEISGPAKLDLRLTVPLGNPKKLKVLGNAQIKQAQIAMPEWNINLDQINGDFQFTETTLTAKKMPARLWGEPTTLSLTTFPAKNKNPSYIEAALAGRLNISNVQNATKIPLTDFLSGSSDYLAQLRLYESNANNEVYLSSNLQGIAVDLPAPFGKSAPEKRNFALNFVIQNVPGFQTQLKYGDLVQAQLNIKTEPGKRIIDIDSSQVEGRVSLAYPFNAKQVVDAQMERLIIDAKSKKTISSIDPRTVPPLIINCKQFIFGNKNLGQLSLSTVPKSNGMAIQSFNLSTTDYSFKSRGQWTGGQNGQQSQLAGTIESSKVNRFLDRMGLTMKGLVVDKGRAAFDLQWKGAPYSFSLATMSGDFSFALEKGRVINLNQSDNNKMDVGRMLSLFSLQTIPRRLSLDFSDLFEQGYSFDFIRGDFSLKQGSAYTLKPVMIEGPVAKVTASGRIGFIAQDYDLSLSVSPYVTESLPVVAGALTLNPFVGAAAWLVNKMVLSKEVSKVITYDYKVTGPWNAPVWKSVKAGKQA